MIQNTSRKYYDLPEQGGRFDMMLQGDRSTWELLQSELSASP
jgi:hypothetical protein